MWCHHDGYEIRKLPSNGFILPSYLIFSRCSKKPLFIPHLGYTITFTHRAKLPIRLLFIHFYTAKLKLSGLFGLLSCFILLEPRLHSERNSLWVSGKEHSVHVFGFWEECIPRENPHKMVQPRIKPSGINLIQFNCILFKVQIHNKVKSQNTFKKRQTGPGAKLHSD